MLRFIDRFGAPKEIINDNAKTFLSGSSLLSDIYLADLYKENLSKFNIDFKTIPVYSPWYGAVYERLIAVVKSCIYKSLQQKVVSYECFRTLLTDIQNSVNSRPIFYKSSEDEYFLAIRYP